MPKNILYFSLFAVSLQKIHIFGEKLKELSADIAKIPVDDEKS